MTRLELVTMVNSLDAKLEATDKSSNSMTLEEVDTEIDKVLDTVDWLTRQCATEQQ